MTKKDFQLIADVLRDYGAAGALCRSMADGLTVTNERFDYMRFYRACGLDDDGHVDPRTDPVYGCCSRHIRLMESSTQVMTTLSNTSKLLGEAMNQLLSISKLLETKPVSGDVSLEGEVDWWAQL